jgi:hypothetical protein
MNHPEFFSAVPPITLHDPLAQLLGAATDGRITYHYLDMVKFAGHSCPTVAGAWILSALGLEDLYGDQLPTRGEIRVELRGALEEGVAGVIGGCIGLLTGAANAGGFKGIGGRFGRNNRLLFGTEITSQVRLTRLDSGAAVTLSYDPSRVPGDPRMPALLQQIAGGDAGREIEREFGRLWQRRVETILSHPERWREWVQIG